MRKLTLVYRSGTRIFGEAMLGCSAQNGGSNRMQAMWRRLLEFTETCENSRLQLLPLWPLTGSRQAHVFRGCSELYRMEVCVSHRSSSACRSVLKFSLLLCLPPVSSSYKRSWLVLSESSNFPKWKINPSKCGGRVWWYRLSRGKRTKDHSYRSMFLRPIDIN